MIHIKELLSDSKISRRSFLKFGLAAFSAFVMSGWLARLAFGQPNKTSGTTNFNARKKKGIVGTHDIVVVTGDDPYAITRKAIESIGGMSRFVKKGAKVVVKPNMGWDRAPEYAANTNPMVVACLVDLCFSAGADRVNVFDRSCNSPQRCYENSGIKKAAEARGAKVYFMDDWNFINANIPYQSPMQGWPIYRDAIECDTFINVPILKHHGLTNLTLSMKNLMGVCGGNRGQIHTDIARKLVDLTDFINPDLTVIDAYRVLNNNGPSGGNLNDVSLLKTVIVGVDPTLVDTYACSLVNKNPQSISYLAEAAKRGFGSMDIQKADIVKLSV